METGKEEESRKVPKFLFGEGVAIEPEALSSIPKKAGVPYMQGIFFLIACFFWHYAAFGDFMAGQAFSLDILSFLGMVSFTPFALITILLLYIEWKSWLRRLLAGITALLGGFLLFFPFPTHYDGMAHRLRSETTEADWIEFSKDLRRQKPLVPESELYFEDGWISENAAIQKILDISPWVSVSPGKGGMRLEWGGALVGHWGILVSETDPVIVDFSGPYGYHPGKHAFSRVWVYRGR